MTTTGTASWNDQILTMITRALRITGAIAEDETPTAGMFEDLLDTANALAKSLQATGAHVWTEEEAIIFLQPGQQRYLLGGSTTDHAADAYSWTLSQLSASAAAAATSVTVQLANPTFPGAGLAVGDNFGVALDSGSTFWTTVSGLPGGSVVHLTNPLPSSSSVGNFAFDYATNIMRPLKVPFARRWTHQGLLETPATVMARKTYQDLPNKNSPGIPTQFFYSPQLLQGQFFPWPVPIDSSSAARITWHRPIFDFDTPADTADMPQEWLNTLTWQLALEAAPEFDVPADRFAIIEKRAMALLDTTVSYDREPEPIQFGIGWDESAQA